MNALGIALIVGGMAFLCSGLIFLPPKGRKRSSAHASFEQSQRQIDYYLREMRKERGEL